MKKLNNNKGAAMITVLIAVTFISILSASLLYMAYMNYLTKSMRYSGTDTFYTDEYALDDLSTALQQIAADSSDISTAKNNFRTACGVTTNASGKKVYTGSTLANNIKYAIKDPMIEKIEIDTAWDTSVSSNFVEEGGSITLGGVKITTTTSSGYVSTIVTDMIFSFPNSGTGDIDVNDFSIIADSQVDAKSGILTLTGNIFCKARNCNQLNPSGDTALLVESSAVCTLLSPRGVIYGDVELESTGALSIAGDVAVTGDIKTESGSVLFISGKLTLNGNITGSGKVIGKDNIIYKNGTMDMSALPDDGTGANPYGLTTDLFTNVMLWNSNSNSFESMDGAELMSYFPNGATYPTLTNLSSSRYSGSKFGSVIRNSATTENGIKSTLMLTTAEFDIQGGGDIVESTILTTCSTEAKIPAISTHMSYMPDDGYEAAKELLIVKNGGAGLPSGFSSNFASGDKSTFDSASNNAAFKVMQYTDDKTNNSGSTTTEPRYAVYDPATGKNYVPYGYLLRADSSSFISTIMNSVLGTQDPSNTSVKYENWYKE